MNRKLDLSVLPKVLLTKEIVALFDCLFYFAYEMRADDPRLSYFDKAIVVVEANFGKSFEEIMEIVTVFEEDKK